MLLHAATIFLSAFLLFQVQPMIAKIILPWFGGTANVWTVCMLFFQVALLLGYLYSYAVLRFLRPRAQTAVHSVLLLASCATLPIHPAAHWKPLDGNDPELRILALLAATIGLPYLSLSTTSPLIQAWVARTHAGALPYRLFALSNVGSLLALISYPVAVEPLLATRTQTNVWSFGYTAFAICCAGSAMLTRNRRAIPEPEADAPAPGAERLLLWLGLSACGSMFLLSVTTHLSQDVAPIPFLWVAPLSVYLLTFIIAFEREGGYPRKWILPLLPPALVAMAYSLSVDNVNMAVKVVVPLFVAGMFVACMACHGEMARSKPHPRHLALFYLMVAAGGAFGGLFVGLFAPAIFSAYRELPIAIVLCAVLILIVLHEELSGPRGRRIWLTAMGLAIAIAGYLANEQRKAAEGTRVTARNFYGSLQVRDIGAPDDSDWARKLVHGTINHGQQYLDPTRRRQPTSYFGPRSGVGQAIAIARSGASQKVGVVGLGAGVIAAYCRSGDTYRFYEINPLVHDLAQSQFTFLKDCPAKVSVILGDGRLSLEREPSQNFDVLALDAFSSDSIPVHLLTREAFDLYFRHLKPDGVLSVQISNRYLDLKPVVRRAIEVFGKHAVLVDVEEDEDSDFLSSTYVLVSGNAQKMRNVSGAPLPPSPGFRLWTDDYSNLFGILE